MFKINKKDEINNAYIAAVGTISTSVVLFPLITKYDNFKNFRMCKIHLIIVGEYLHDFFKHGVAGVFSLFVDIHHIKILKQFIPRCCQRALKAPAV